MIASYIALYTSGVVLGKEGKKSDCDEMIKNGN